MTHELKIQFNYTLYQTIKMGASQSAGHYVDPTINAELIDQTSQYKVYRNHRGEQFQKYKIIDKRNYDIQNTYDYRIRNSSPYLVNAYSAKSAENSFGCISGNEYQVVTQRIPLRLSDLNLLSGQQSLNMVNKSLAGFQQLYNSRGPFLVRDSMIGLNRQNNIKVWMNSNFGLNQIEQLPISYGMLTEHQQQSTMVDNIIQIINSKSRRDPQWLRFLQERHKIGRIGFDSAIRLSQNQFSYWSKQSGGSLSPPPFPDRILQNQMQSQTTAYQIKNIPLQSINVGQTVPLNQSVFSNNVNSSYPVNFQTSVVSPNLNFISSNPNPVPDFRSRLQTVQPVQANLRNRIIGGAPAHQFNNQFKIEQNPIVNHHVQHNTLVPPIPNVQPLVSPHLIQNQRTPINRLPSQSFLQQNVFQNNNLHISQPKGQITKQRPLSQGKPFNMLSNRSLLGPKISPDKNPGPVQNQMFSQTNVVNKPSVNNNIGDGNRMGSNSPQQNNRSFGKNVKISFNGSLPYENRSNGVGLQNNFNSDKLTSQNWQLQQPQQQPNTRLTNFGNGQQTNLKHYQPNNRIQLQARPQSYQYSNQDNRQQPFHQMSAQLQQPPPQPPPQAQVTHQQGQPIAQTETQHQEHQHQAQQHHTRQQSNNQQSHSLNNFSNQYHQYSQQQQYQYQQYNQKHNQQHNQQPNQSYNQSYNQPYNQHNQQFNQQPNQSYNQSYNQQNNQQYNQQHNQQYSGQVTGNELTEHRQKVDDTSYIMVSSNKNSITNQNNTHNENQAYTNTQQNYLNQAPNIPLITQNRHNNLQTVQQSLANPNQQGHLHISQQHNVLASHLSQSNHDLQPQIRINQVTEHSDEAQDENANANYRQDFVKQNTVHFVINKQQNAQVPQNYDTQVSYYTSNTQIKHQNISKNRQDQMAVHEQQQQVQMIKNSNTGSIVTSKIQVQPLRNNQMVENTHRQQYRPQLVIQGKLQRKRSDHLKEQTNFRKAVQENASTIRLQKSKIAIRSSSDLKGIISYKDLRDLLKSTRKNVI